MPREKRENLKNQTNINFYISMYCVYKITYKHTNIYSIHVQYMCDILNTYTAFIYIYTAYIHIFIDIKYTVLIAFIFIYYK